ncbi:MAG: hypothetical protein LBR32_05935 [Propionibacteriaceae bacterium]|jgi:hypothetical protein|nr:hypothetical protein [Propionibacteriaceae bacterium]
MKFHVEAWGFAMQLDLTRDWPEIASYVDRAIKASKHVCLGTAGPDGRPTVTPIGTLVLNGDCTGLFLERFPRSLGRDADYNRQVCVLAEVTKLGQLWRQFRRNGWIGLKLYGELGDRRAAAPDEISRILARLPIRTPKTQRLLLGESPQVRPLRITRAEAIAAQLDKASGIFRAI